MASYKWRELKKALKAKGFVDGRDTGHQFLYLVIDGQETGISTHVGDHNEDLGDELQNRIAKKQLLMPSSRFLAEYVSCTKGLKHYRAHLIASGEYVPNQS